jgi:hypothetical protein
MRPVSRVIKRDHYGIRNKEEAIKRLDKNVSTTIVQ